jgi:hypothetical protein
MSAVFLAVPLLDWFRPWQYRLSVAGERANRRAASSRSDARDATGLRHHARACSRAPRGLQFVKARGVRGDVVGVRPAFPQHEVQHAVEQHHVGAGLHGQVQVGDLGGVGAARVARR